MDELEQARQEIDAVDAQLAALFERRMRAVVQVALYKKAHGLPIHDPAREEQVLQKAADRIQDPTLRPYYLDHVRNRMAVARQYEALLLGQNRVAYQGVEGAFAHIALRELFPHAEAVSCPTWGRGVCQGVGGGCPPTGWSLLRTATPATCRRCWICATTTPSCGWCRSTTCRWRQNLLVLPGAALTASATSTATSRPSPRARRF